MSQGTPRKSSLFLSLNIPAISTVSPLLTFATASRSRLSMTGCVETAFPSSVVKVRISTS